MLTISKPMGASKAQTYYQKEYANSKENYYTEEESVEGEWQGKLAEKWGLRGAVSREAFDRLAEGNDPNSGEKLVKSVIATREGKKLEHRAGWDFTISAPKSVSVTALVGGDERLLDAHREAVAAALDAVERYTQARMGGSRMSETTKNFIAAKFEHQSSREHDAQLHTHCFVFNMTEAGEKIRSIDARELFRSQQFGTAVYRAELADRIQKLGYQVEVSEKTGAPEIVGYTREYLEANSKRSQQIDAHLKAEGIDREAIKNNGGTYADAAQRAAYSTRKEKDVSRSKEEVRTSQRELAAQHGNQPRKVVSEALERGPVQRNRESEEVKAKDAVVYAEAEATERAAVFDERRLYTLALTRHVGETTVAAIRTELKNERVKGELVPVAHPDGRSAAKAYTTREILTEERSNVRAVSDGREKHARLLSEKAVEGVSEKIKGLNPDQKRAFEGLAEGRDKIMGVQGYAGVGKTHTLRVVREAAEQDGYTVRGLAPTGRATQALAESGIDSKTLQKHLKEVEKRPNEQGPSGKNLYILDESSLGSTKQMKNFFDKLRDTDRVVLVGDKAQHQSVEAGKAFQQFQQAGMKTFAIQEVVRQKDAPELKEAVEHFSRQEVRAGIRKLEGIATGESGERSRVVEEKDTKRRYQMMARDYAASPNGTLVVSPTNEERRALNEAIHKELQKNGLVEKNEHMTRILENRKEVSNVGRSNVLEYHTGDVVRFRKGSSEHNVAAGEYAMIEKRNVKANTLTVRFDDGRTVTYNPKKELKETEIYKKSERPFSVGDRVQFRKEYQPEKGRRIANGELGKIERIDGDRMSVQVDAKGKETAGRMVEVNIKKFPHVDYGYAVTSHSSQGETVNRVLVNMDTRRGEAMVNERMAYVAVSRAKFEVVIYTNNQEKLAEKAARVYENSSATEQMEKLEGKKQDGHGETKEQREPEGRREIGERQNREHGSRQESNFGLSL